MQTPRVRTVNKSVPPYELGQFPPSFVETLAKHIVYIRATKNPVDIRGEEWEQIFADCVGAKWKPSNVGLDDIALENCCWGAKTVKTTVKNIGTQKDVRLISGRNSLTYSYDIAQSADGDPSETGKLVLEIWNERVSGVRQIYKFVRTVVLVKSESFDDFLVFETNTVRYDAEQYFFKWNKKGNLEGYDKYHKHKFTWQPSGGQFTIIESIPKDRLHLKVKKPDTIPMEDVLNSVRFDRSFYSIVP